MNSLKKHLTSLIAPSNFRWTIILLVSSALLIIGSQIIGITDNLPGIAMLFTGTILLFFSLLHPWRQTINYIILAAVSLGITVLIFLGIFILSSLHLDKYISEAFVMITIFLFCLPGLVVGIIGILLCAKKKK